EIGLQLEAAVVDAAPAGCDLAVPGEADRDLVAYPVIAQEVVLDVISEKGRREAQPGLIGAGLIGARPERAPVHAKLAAGRASRGGARRHGLAHSAQGAIAILTPAPDERDRP